MTSRNIVRAPRKNRIWGLAAHNGTIVAATAAGMLQFPLMALLKADVGYELPGVIASAIRLNVQYRQTTSQSTDDDTLAMGIAWISDTAIASGGAELPDPSTDHFDWMFHDFRTVSGLGSSDQDSVAANGHFVISNDSMRKQRENHSSLTMVIRATLLQSTSVQVFVAGRILYLLP